MSLLTGELIGYKAPPLPEHYTKKKNDRGTAACPACGYKTIVYRYRNTTVEGTFDLVEAICQNKKRKKGKKVCGHVEILKKTKVSDRTTEDFRKSDTPTPSTVSPVVSGEGSLSSPPASAEFKDEYWIGKGRGRRLTKEGWQAVMRLIDEGRGPAYLQNITGASYDTCKRWISKHARQLDGGGNERKTLKIEKITDDDVAMENQRLQHRIDVIKGFLDTKDEEVQRLREDLESTKDCLARTRAIHTDDQAALIQEEIMHIHKQLISYDGYTPEYYRSLTRILTELRSQLVKYKNGVNRGQAEESKPDDLPAVL